MLEATFVHFSCSWLLYIIPNFPVHQSEYGILKYSAVSLLDFSNGNTSTGHFCWKKIAGKGKIMYSKILHEWLKHYRSGSWVFPGFCKLLFHRSHEQIAQIFFIIFCIDYRKKPQTMQFEKEILKKKKTKKKSQQNSQKGFAFFRFSKFVKEALKTITH